MCCQALGLNLSTYQYRKHKQIAGKEDDKDEKVVTALKEIIKEHSGYGYRRLGVELREEKELLVNHKRLRRLLSEYELVLPRCTAAYKPSRVQKTLGECKGKLDLVKGRNFGLLEVFSTDFTELKYANGKAVLMAMIDIVGKSVMGWALSERRNTELALECWQRTKEELQGYRVPPKGLLIHSDKDSVYTGYEWLNELLIEDEAVVSYSENGSRDNPWVEALWSRTKDEWGSRLVEAESIEELEVVVREWFEYYNHRRRHSSLGYQAPITYLKSNWSGENAASDLA